MRRRHWHGAVNVVPERRRKRPVTAHRELRPVVAQRSPAARQLREAAFAFAESSMAGRALLGINLRAPDNAALARGQARAIVAAHVDIPACDLCGAGCIAVAVVAGLGGM